jgi:hypothetical protein
MTIARPNVELTSGDFQREKNKLSQRKKRTARKLREKRIEISKADILKRLPSINFRNYQKFNLEEKFQFAANGYCFKNNPNIAAIEIFETTIKTSKGMGKGVKVGKAMKELPPGFIILCSYDRIINKPGRHIQLNYQVNITGNRYMQLHTQPDPRRAYGLLNFINTALPRKADPEKSLSTITDQDMKKNQCKLRWTIKGVAPKTKARFPAHAIVLDTIPQGDELLMKYKLHKPKTLK